MPGMWGVIVMVIATGSNGSVSYVPFYDMAACEASKAELSRVFVWGTRATCVPTVTGNPGKHNDR
jgi:hypothetical protein